MTALARSSVIISLVSCLMAGSASAQTGAWKGITTARDGTVWELAALSDGRNVIFEIVRVQKKGAIKITCDSTKTAKGGPFTAYCRSQSERFVLYGVFPNEVKVARETSMQQVEATFAMTNEMGSAQSVQRAPSPSPPPAGQSSIPNIQSLPAPTSTGSSRANEQQMRQDADTFNKTVAGGAIVGGLGGAVVGGLVGFATTGKGSGAAKGALIGGVAGGVLGGVDGYITAKREQNANNQVRTLNAMAEDIRQENENLRRMNESSKRVLADSNARLAQIKSDVAAKKMSVAEANEERARIEENKKVMESALETARKKNAAYREVAAKQRAEGVNTGRMDAQIAQTEKEIHDLEASINSLNYTLQVTRVG